VLQCISKKHSRCRFAINTLAPTLWTRHRSLRDPQSSIMTTHSRHGRLYSPSTNNYARQVDDPGDLNIEKYGRRLRNTEIGSS